MYLIMDCTIWFSICIMAGTLTGCQAYRWEVRHDSMATYMLSDKPLPWADAQNFCQESDSSLLVIKSKEEQQWLQERLDRHHEPLIWWIGLSYNRQESNWEWIDGVALDTNIITWEPDNNDECIEYVRKNGDIRNHHCTAKNAFICYSDQQKLTQLQVPFSFATLEPRKIKLDWKRAYQTCLNNASSVIKVSSHGNKEMLHYFIIYDERECLSRLFNEKETHDPTSDISRSYSQPAELQKKNSKYCAGTHNGHLGDYDCNEKMHFICKGIFTPRLSLELPTHSIDFAINVKSIFLCLLILMVVCLFFITIGIGAVYFVQEKYNSVLSPVSRCQRNRNDTENGGFENVVCM